jgi:hypothetical protein
MALPALLDLWRDGRLISAAYQSFAIDGLQ